MPPAESQPPKPDPWRAQRAWNLALAGVAGQVGCLTLVIVAAALLGGLWVDSLFNTRPLFTILLVIGSMPVSLFLMYRVAMGAIARITPPPRRKEETSVVQDD